MIERISLRIFWAMMLSCAMLAITAMWIGEPSDVHGKIIFTTFVIGLASFLVWSPLMAYRFHRAIAEKR